jgi:hypothetical protein
LYYRLLPLFSFVFTLYPPVEIAATTGDTCASFWPSRNLPLSPLPLPPSRAPTTITIVVGRVAVRALHSSWHCSSSEVSFLGPRSSRERCVSAAG